MAYQLATQLPVYWDRLNASPLDKIAIETNLPAIFDQLFVSLVSDAVPLTDNPHVLLIDALDEATSKGKNELASLIGHEFKRLPSWLRVVVTSRPHEKEINFAFQALDPWKIDAGREENVGDIRAYLDRELRPFTGDGAPPESTLQQIISKSEHLFLYVSWVRQELEDGHLSLKDVEKFPQGLGGIYAEFFQRYFPDLHAYETLCRPALEAICAVREPIEHSSLASLLGRSKYEMRQLMAGLGSLFPIVDGRVTPFHQTVRDWLVDPDRSGDYWIDVSVQDQRLADLAWREYAGGVNTMERYCIKFAPFHLAACKRKDELKKLLLDPEWIQAKLRISGVVSLQADYDLALETLSPKSTERSVRVDPATGTIELVKVALRLSSHIIGEDPTQFPSQMVGRLLPHQDLAAIEDFAQRTARGATKPWLRPLQPALYPPGTSLVRILQGHTDKVYGVALSGDGRRAVSASLDHTLKVWDVETGRELRTLQGHTDGVPGVALSGDGRRAVSASRDRTLKVWDVETGRELRTLHGHTDGLPGVALSGDGRRAVSASLDQTLKVWDVETGRELRTLQGHTSSVYGVALSWDGRRAVSASRDRTLKVWDVETGRELRILQGHTRGVAGVALSPDGRRAVSASRDRTLKVWDVETGRELRALHGHTDSVQGVALSRDGRRAVSASGDKTLNVWDVEAGSKLRILHGHTDSVQGVALSRDGRRAISASRDRTLKVWDVETGRELRTLQGHTDVVWGVALSEDGRRAVSVTSDEFWYQALKVWDVETGRELCHCWAHTDSVTDVALSGDGRRAVSASDDRTLKVWDVETGREFRALQGHTGIVRVIQVEAPVVHGVALSGDGRRAVSASSDRTVKVWDVETGEVTVIFTCDGAAMCCAFIDKLIVAGDAGGHVHFLRLEEPNRKN